MSGAASEQSGKSGASILQAIVADNLGGAPRGIYSVCCSHPLAIEAAVDQALDDGSILLVEATANQVNQFGGYTGMTPADYYSYVSEIAAARGLALDRLVLGGDHLGPVCWTDDPAEIAMDKAETLVRDFAAAGFSKIHLDCSMPLQGDPDILSDDVVASRAARLCAAAEEAALSSSGHSDIVYVIGTEVPPPGGADEELESVSVTPSDRALKTLAVHKEAFAAQGLNDAWSRVIALVVQPGVEFDNSAIIDYIPSETEDLKRIAETETGGIGFEAHSTDYQLDAAFGALVRHHFVVLKVGPALTFAMREALFALSHIEDELFPAEARSNLRGVCDAQMLAAPKNWQRFYEGNADQQRLLRRYSLSDRIRYYWPDPVIEAAAQKLIANLSSAPISLGLLSQYMPYQYQAVREGKIVLEPRALIKDRIRNAIAPYAAACGGQN